MTQGRSHAVGSVDVEGSLEPYIDSETVELHYKKHLQGYVDKINKIFEGI